MACDGGIGGGPDHLARSQSHATRRQRLSRVTPIFILYFLQSLSIESFEPFMNVRCLLHCEKYHCKKHSVPVPRCVFVSAEEVRDLDLTTDVMPETRVNPRAFHLICANTCAFSRLSPSRRIQPHLPLLCLKCHRLGSSWSCSIAGSPTPSSALPLAMPQKESAKLAPLFSLFSLSSRSPFL